MADISAFLEAKGSLDILFKLAEKEKSFNELEEALGLSPNTVLLRLREAQSLELIKEELFKDSGRSKIKYTLTDTGKELLNSLKTVKEDYLNLRKDVGKLEEEKRQKETEIRELLSSVQGSTAIVSIKDSKIKNTGNLTIMASSTSGSEQRIKKKSDK